MVRIIPPITAPHVDQRPDAQPDASTQERYSLAQLLKGMKAGDMPVAPGWDRQPRKGRDAW